MRPKQLTVTLFGVNKLSSTLERGQKDIRRFGASARSAGRSMSVGLTAPLALFGAATVRSASSFEAAMNRVKGVSRASAEEIKALTEQAKEQGRTTQFSASEAAAAQEELARAGFSTNEILAALPKTLELAASSNVDLAEAAGIASGMLNGFKFEAEDLGRVNDVLVSTNLRTKTDLVSLSEAMKEVAPIAAGMGLSIEEVATAAGALGDNLLEGGRGGVGLKTVLASLLKPSAEAKAALSRLGIPEESLRDSKGNVRSLIAVVEELEKSGAQAGDFFTIFGQRGAVAMQALVGTGAAELKKLHGELTGPGSVGEASRQAAIRMEGAEGAMKGLASAFEGLQIAIGDSGLLQAVTELANWGADMLRWVAALNPEILKWATVLGGVAAAIGPVLIGVGLMAQGFTLIAPIVVGGMLVVSAALATIFSPIGAVIAAVALLGWWATELVGDWGLVKAIGVKFWGEIQTVLEHVYRTLKLMFPAVDAFAVASQLVMKHWEPIKTFFDDLWKGMSEGYRAFERAVPDFIRNRLGVDVDGTSAPAVSGSAPMRSLIGGKVEIVLGSNGQLRATRVTSANDDVPINVMSGPILAGY